MEEAQQLREAVGHYEIIKKFIYQYVDSIKQKYVQIMIQLCFFVNSLY